MTCSKEVFEGRQNRLDTRATTSNLWARARYLGEARSSHHPPGALDEQGVESLLPSPGLARMFPHLVRRGRCACIIGSEREVRRPFGARVRGTGRVQASRDLRR